MKKTLSLVIIAAAISVAQAAQDDPLKDVNEIVKKAYQTCYYPGDDGQRKARMMIVDKDGNKQLRQFNVFRKDQQDAGDQDFLVVFERPSDVKGTVFLVNKHIESDDDRWIYLPGLDLEKRISASDKRTSFVGSNYFYEDISGRNYRLDNYELIKEDDGFYYIKGTPKEANTVEFENFIMQISKEDFMPRVIDYYKAGNKLYRKVEIMDVEMVDNFATVFKSKITDLETGGYTLVQFKKPAYDVGLEADLFSQRSLRNPPKDLQE
ncbi:MAG: outer membrane lipoprotein-sorting protein [Kangiellaceae bacterium]|nr:outer membrane lipoprotein-sorting protein [Kangiellaceae bacterium]